MWTKSTSVDSGGWRESTGKAVGRILVVKEKGYGKGCIAERVAVDVSLHDTSA